MFLLEFNDGVDFVLSLLWMNKKQRSTMLLFIHRC